MQQASGDTKGETGLRHAAVQLLSHVCLLLIAWVVARQAPLSMGFPMDWVIFPSPCFGFLAVRHVGS